MPLNTTEKQFESDIAAALLSPAGSLLYLEKKYSLCPAERNI